MRLNVLLINNERLNIELESILYDELIDIVAKANKGHRIQVTDIPISTMKRLCQRLQTSNQEAKFYVISNEPQDEYEITSTRLITLRNELEETLLIFVPNDLRTAAEDSFAINNFMKYRSASSYLKLKEKLLSEMDDELRKFSTDVLHISGVKDLTKQCRFLISLLKQKDEGKDLGTSIVNLGLVPDKSLHPSGDHLLEQISKNIEYVRKLSEIKSTQSVRFNSLALRPSDTTTLLREILQKQQDPTPEVWLKELITHERADELTFDQWPIETQVETIDTMKILDIGLRERTEDGYLYLNLDQQRSMKISWETDPAPIYVTSLDHFTIEILQDEASIEISKRISKGPARSKLRSSTIAVAALDEQGIYQIKVTAFDNENIALAEAISETFLVSKQGGDDPDGRKSDDRTVRSIYEGNIRALREQDTNDEEVPALFPELIDPPDLTTNKVNEQYEVTIRYNTKTKYRLRLYPKLVNIEIDTLKDPDCLGRWEIDLSNEFSDTASLMPFENIDGDRLEKFYSSRRRLFDQILLQKNVIELIDINGLADEIVDHAKAYEEVLIDILKDINATPDPIERETLISKNKQITNIDIVKCKMNATDDIYLLAPTHPLRLLYTLQLARATTNWSHRITTTRPPKEEIDEIIEFLSNVSCMNLPSNMSSLQGDTYLNIDTLDMYWGIYAKEGAKDLGSLLSRLMLMVGGQENTEKISSISFRSIMQQLERYLEQHPFVETLVLNAFNPGGGSILVKTMLEMQKTYPDLKYKVNLFSEGTYEDVLGHTFDDLKRTATLSKGTAETDAFLEETGDKLYPKLVYSKNNLSEYIDHPEKFDAHITLMFDVFSAGLDKGVLAPEIRSNFIYGIIDQYHDTYVNDKEKKRTCWKRQIALKHGVDVDDGLNGHDVFVNLANRISHINTVIYDHDTVGDERLEVILRLGPKDKNILSLIHQHSDWVLIIDRNFGIEFLDDPFDEDEPIYLIDHKPDQYNNAGHRMIVSTKEITEVIKLITPVLDALNIEMNDREKEVLIQALGSISGQLVQKLMTRGTSPTESIGMALARIFLEQSDLLDDMILIPLDSLQSLLRKGLSSNAGQERSDLLLVEMNNASRSLIFHNIEVKFRSTNDLDDLLELKPKIRAQLKNTENALRDLFEIHEAGPDRLDRMVRTLGLGNILKHYSERSTRYLLLDKENLPYIISMINELEEGYALEVKNYGILFSSRADGYHFEEDEGVLFHYVGANKIKDQVRAACEAFETKSEIPEDPDYRATRSTFTKRHIEGLRTSAKGLGKVSEVEEEHDTQEDRPPEVIEEKEVLEEKEEDNGPEELCKYEAVIGGKEGTAQIGIIGKIGADRIALDINSPNAISIFGVQGSGKSYTLGAIIEMALMPIKNINILPRPLAGIVFHYSQTEEYQPEFTSITQKNSGSEIQDLLTKYQALPQGLEDVIILSPAYKVEDREKEFPGLRIEPIQFNSNELQIDDWKFLMGAVGNNALYVKAINAIIRRLFSQKRLTFNDLFSSIVDLNKSQSELANQRLVFAKEYINDDRHLGDLLRPGRLLIVDLRDPLISKEEAMGLFMVIQRIFSNVRFEDKVFNKLIVFDEAHNYMNTDFVEDVVSSIRLMRHQGNIIVIASQDPESVPIKMIELSSMVILHKMNSPSWLKHIQKAVTALGELRAGQLNLLQSGQAYIWAAESTEHAIMNRAVKVDIRPRVTEHGGKTKKATG